MIEITITGLNARQQALADMLWAFEDGRDVDRFIRTLPTAELRAEARSIKELMLLAAVEQCYDGIQDTEQVTSILKQFTL